MRGEYEIATQLRTLATHKKSGTHDAQKAIRAFHRMQTALSNGVFIPRSPKTEVSVIFRRFSILIKFLSVQCVPACLNERSSGATSANQVFLSLMLLDFEGEAGAQNASWQRKEGDAGHSANGGNDFADRRLRHRVAVAHCAQRYHSPPQSVWKRKRTKSVD